MKADDRFKWINKDKSFTLMHCFLKLQKLQEMEGCLIAAQSQEKHWPFRTTVGIGRSPIGNKKAKVVVAVATHSERVQSAVDKCVPELTAGKAAKEEKNDNMWAVIMAKQDINIKLEKKCVAVKKRKEDFMLFTTNHGCRDKGVVLV
jgi:hypothetical protein